MVCEEACPACLLLQDNRLCRCMPAAFTSLPAYEFGVGEAGRGAGRHAIVA